MRPVKKIVLLHDLCTVGKAALTNMMPVLSAMGIEACPIPTVLLSTHTGGYGKPAILKTDPEYICACADHYRKEGVVFDGIFAGYPGSADVLEAMRYFVNTFPEAPVIFDPIMGDHGRYYSNFDDSYGLTVNTFLEEAEVLIPNLTEACLLSQVPYRTDFSEKEILDLCRKLDRPGKKKRTVVLTSAPSETDQKGIAVYRRDGEKEEFSVSYFPRYPGEFHGTGDLFDGVFLAQYINGRPALEAVSLAHTFVKDCIKMSDCFGYPKREGLLVEKSLALLRAVWRSFPEN